MCNMCRIGDDNPKPFSYFPEQEFVAGEKYWPPFLWVLVLALVCLLMAAVVTGELG